MIDVHRLPSAAGPLGQRAQLAAVGGRLAGSRNPHLQEKRTPRRGHPAHFRAVPAGAPVQAVLGVPLGGAGDFERDPAHTGARVLVQAGGKREDCNWVEIQRAACCLK